jgi:F-box and WD-40 domain protein 1/11
MPFHQLLPTEVALHIFSYLTSKTLSHCSLVSRRWRTLADDYTLWKRLCTTKEWHWKSPPSRPYLHFPNSQPTQQHDTDDEGMGDEEIEMVSEIYSRTADDSGFVSSISDDPWEESSFVARFQSSTGPAEQTSSSSQTASRKLVPRLPSPFAPVAQSTQHQRPNYKLLHHTRTRLHHRFLSGSYRLSTLQSRGTPGSHTNTIYCLQLYTYPESGNQVLFTGSKDRTIKEWDLTTGAVLRTIEGIHEGSVLSICVYGDYLASAGSDSNVVVWDLRESRVVKVIDDHEDSVLCVRFDDARLVSCSKGELVVYGNSAATDVLSTRPYRPQLPLPES